MLQTRRIPQNYASVQTQQDLDFKTLKEVIMKKEQEIELLKTQREAEVKALRNHLDVSNILISKKPLTLTSLELQLLFFFTRNTCHFPSDLASALSQFA
jgi:hypothetical protein